MTDTKDGAEIDVRVVTVSYNSEAVLPEFLTGLLSGDSAGNTAGKPTGLEVVVVDNASTDRSADIARAHGAKLVKLTKNEGFGRACNAGAKGAKSAYLFFVNPDAVVSQQAIGELCRAAVTYPQAVAFNPRILDGNGDVAFKRRSRILPHTEWMVRGGPNTDAKVTVLHGSALFCRRDEFEAIGGFDPKIFLYHEDDDLSLRLRAMGRHLMLIPKAIVRHKEGRSSTRSPGVARLKSFHMGWSCLYVMRKHHRPWARLRSLGTALGKCLSPLSWVSPRKRAQATGFLSGVISAMGEKETGR